MRAFLIYIASLFGFLLCGIPAAAQAEDENFVVASLLIADPDEVLYSCVGHACFRMQCPAYDMDFCFSYEGENARHEILRFFAGRLKMGMMGVPTSQYLDLYRTDGRGVREYRLQLPLEVKRRLWKILDERVAEGKNLSYDYVARGCAVTSARILEQAVGENGIRYTSWPEYVTSHTQREVFARYISDVAPWSLLVIQTITGVEVDASVPWLDRIILPADLVQLWSAAEVDGRSILSGESQQLVPSRLALSQGWLKPWYVAFFMLLLVVAESLTCWRCVSVVLLTMQAVLALFVTYLLLMPGIPNNSWNWLAVPFNLLPFLFWHWRYRWSLPFAIVLCLWALVMSCWPHRLTDDAYIFLAVALAIVYLRISGYNIFNKLKNREK